MPIHCGVFSSQIRVAYKNTEMELISKRVPGDKGNIHFYSIPLAAGQQTLDLEYDLDKNCEATQPNGWHAECIISPNRFKKTTSDSNKAP